MRSPVSSPTMIGRSDDLAEMTAALDGILDGSPRGIVIEGEAGIGKSRLLAEFVKAMPDDVLVLSGQCVDIGSVGAPFTSVKAVLRDLVAALGAEEVVHAAGFGAPAIATILPELGVAPRVAGSGDPDELIDAIAMLVKTISADRPIAIVLEDVHWADAATLALLKALVQVLRRGHVLVVLTVRTEDVGANRPLRQMLAEIERSRAVARIDVHRLDRAQVAEQVVAISGDRPSDDLIDRMFDRSGGVPFLVEELIPLGAETLPGSLRGVMLARYDALDEHTRELLRVLAAGGTTVADEVLAQVYDVPPGQLEESVRRALAAHVIAANGDGYAFRHALVREALHDELLPREAVLMHTRYAEVLEAAGETSPADIAAHWIAAHDAPRAFSASLAAMDEARRTLATVTVGPLGDQCLELWDRVPDAEVRARRDRAALLAEVAFAYYNCGELERASERCEDALEASDPEDVHRRAELLLLTANTSYHLGRPGPETIALEALKLLDERLPEAYELRARLARWVSSYMANKVGIENGLPLAERAVELSELGADGAIRAEAQTNLGRLLVFHGETAEGLRLLALGEQFDWGDSPQQSQVAATIGDTYLHLGLYDDVIRVSEEAMQISRELGRERMWGSGVGFNAVQAYFERGDWGSGDALLRRLLSLDPPRYLDVAYRELLVMEYVWRDDIPAAVDELERYGADLDQLVGEEPQDHVLIARVRGWTAYFMGDLEDAWTAVASVTPHVMVSLPGLGLPVLALGGTTLAARRSTDAISAAEAAGQVAEYRAVFERMPSWDIVPRWRALFEASVGGAGLVGDDPGLWSAAAEAVDHPTMPAQLYSQALLELAKAQLAAGDRPVAAETAVRAGREAERRGIALVARLAREFAVQAGLAKAGRAGDRDARAGEGDVGLGSLSGREQQVLELIAEGLSNGQIGDRLFISTKTASVHVSAILRKLGVSSRTEAAVLAARKRA